LCRRRTEERKKERKNMKMKTMLGEREKFGGGDVWWYINWIHAQAVCVFELGEVYLFYLIVVLLLIMIVF
jgi:hypothetical protein